MGSFELRFKSSVAKDLRGLPRVVVERILKRCLSLAANPFPRGSEKLGGQRRYRVRVGRYRILYEVTESEVIVVAVKHRRDVYRRR